ncbi:MAG: NAD(P)-binding domain-containing protein [Planctomycetota bacterium]
MKIAFIGYGSMTKALAGKWAGKHELFIGGRNLEKAAGVAAEYDSASGDTAAAVAFGEVVVIATPHGAVFDAIDAVGVEAFAGKIVIDINNPVPGAFDGDFALKSYDGKSLAEAIADKLPRAHVVKAFNTCQAAVWAMPQLNFDGRQFVMPTCGNDANAKQIVHQLAADVGCDTHDFGDVTYARQLEAMAAMTIQLLLNGADPHTVFALIQPEKKAII